LVASACFLRCATSAFARCCSGTSSSSSLLLSASARTVTRGALLGAFAAAGSFLAAAAAAAAAGPFFCCAEGAGCVPYAASRAASLVAQDWLGNVQQSSACRRL
jgi:hypothetical protein